MTRAALTYEQIETAKATFALTNNLSEAARSARCSKTSVRKYIKLDDEFSAMRAEKQAITIEEIIVKIGQVQERLLDAMLDETKVAKASMQEIATSLGIVTDKRQLLAGQPTTRNDNIASDAASRLTPEQMEQAAKIRERLSAQVLG